jgi:hypothetical protein
MLRRRRPKEGSAMAQKKPVLQRLKDGVRNVVDTVKTSLGFDLTARFNAGESQIDFPVDMEGDTVWASTQKIADLFEVDRSVASKHIKSIFDSGELEDCPATRAKIAQVGNEGDREVSRMVEHFSLDVILAVGYRVSGKRATAFRKWASQVLKGYIQDGYALDGRRLEKDPAALLSLAQEVRAIRTSEKNLYAQVREVFAVASIDYDKDSDAARKFFSEAQDTMHYAATEKTASEILVERSDASKPNMGLVALGNRRATKADALVAKNYCPPEELRRMQLIGEAFLLYVEGLAEREKQVSMVRLLEKFKAMVAFYDYPVFPGYVYKRPTAKQAQDYVSKQYEMFKKSSSLPPA